MGYVGYALPSQMSGDAPRNSPSAVAISRLSASMHRKPRWIAIQNVQKSSVTGSKYDEPGWTASQRSIHYDAQNKGIKNQSGQGFRLPFAVHVRRLRSGKPALLIRKDGALGITISCRSYRRRKGFHEST